MDYFEKHKIDKESIYEQAIVYYEGEGSEVDYNNALKWLIKSAEKGHASSLYRIGLMHYRGHGLDQNENEALKWFRKSSSRGHKLAEYYKDMIELDIQENELYFEEKFKQDIKLDNQMEIAYEQAFVYYEGEEVKQDYNKALEYFTESAEKGHASALYRIGLMYYRGYGLYQDYKEALKWFEKSASLGHMIAEYRIGIIYSEGQGVEQNLEKALEYYKRAAEKGSQSAIHNIASSYQLGEVVKRDHAKALECYQKIEDYDEDISVQHNLGVLYNEMGEYKNALQCYKKAALQGKSASLSNLANMYLSGEGVEVDYLKGIEYYEKAAATGYGGAYFNLGIMHLNGIGVGKHKDKALAYFKKALECDFKKAQNFIDELEKDPNKNFKTALKWGKKFAEVAFIITAGMYDNIAKKAEQEIKSRERELSKLERSTNMNNVEYSSKVNVMKKNLEKQKSQINTRIIFKDSFKNIVKIAPNQIGVYVFYLEGKVKYVGRAIENRPDQNPCGLRKRLQEHWRGASAGKIELYIHRESLAVKLHPCSTVEEAIELEGQFIRRYDTVNNGWNLRYED